MKFLTIALGYFPYVLAGIQAVESTLSGQSGATKKTLVLSAVTAATKVGEQVPETHVQTISSLIDAIVSELNASGIFAHKTPPAA
jgi:hypothetical protein